MAWALPALACGAPHEAWSCAVRRHTGIQCTCEAVCVFVCIHVCVCVCVHTHTHTHTHTCETVCKVGRQRNQGGEDREHAEKATAGIGDGKSHLHKDRRGLVFRVRRHHDVGKPVVLVRAVQITIQAVWHHQLPPQLSVLVRDSHVRSPLAHEGQRILHVIRLDLYAPHQRLALARIHDAHI
jgi:hypothetical protein